MDNAVGTAGAACQSPEPSDTLNNARECHAHIRINAMVRWISGLAFLPILLLTNQGRADPLEYIGKPVRGIPVSSAVKVGKSIFVSVIPPFDSSGKLAVVDFLAQVKQVMDNLTGI